MSKPGQGSEGFSCAQRRRRHTDDYATTSGPVVDTADSFSVGLRVRFADTTPDRPMAVPSQGGADAMRRPRTGR
ncbi:hypothetical protein [Streptomyces sp. NPDC000994]